MPEALIFKTLPLYGICVVFLQYFPLDFQTSSKPLKNVFYKRRLDSEVKWRWIHVGWDHTLSVEHVGQEKTLLTFVQMEGMCKQEEEGTNHQNTGCTLSNQWCDPTNHVDFTWVSGLYSAALVWLTLYLFLDKKRISLEQQTLHLDSDILILKIEMMTFCSVTWRVGGLHSDRIHKRWSCHRCSHWRGHWCGGWRRFAFVAQWQDVFL